MGRIYNRARGREAEGAVPRPDSGNPLGLSTARPEVPEPPRPLALSPGITPALSAARPLARLFYCLGSMMTSSSLGSGKSDGT